MTAPDRAPSLLPAELEDAERALLIERIQFVFSIGPNEMFPRCAASRSASPSEKGTAA